MISENPLGYAFFTALTIGTYLLIRKKEVERLSVEEVEYDGSCHCKAVKFKVKAPKHLVVWDCNCSICYMKKNWHFVVPQSSFHQIKGEDDLNEYRFNTKKAKHMFCKHCGVQAYYVPRSNPDGIAVTLACIDPKQVSEVSKYTNNDPHNYDV